MMMRGGDPPPRLPLGPHEALREFPYANPTSEPGHPRKKIPRNRPQNPIMMPHQSLLR